MRTRNKIITFAVAMAMATATTTSVANASNKTESSSLEFTIVDTTVYDGDSIGYANSCYDIDKDGVASVFDMVLLKRFLLNTPATPQYALDNSERFRASLQTVEEFLNEECPAWFARVTDIHLDAVQETNGYLSGNTFLYTVTFDRVLDEEAIYCYCGGSLPYEEMQSYIGTTDTLRIAMANAVNVEAVVPVSNGDLTVEYEIVNQSDTEIVVADYLAERCPRWYAMVNDISVKMNEEGVGTATITFDRVLDEEAVYTLLNCENPEEELAYIAENDICKVRMVIDGVVNITAVSAVK